MRPKSPLRLVSSFALALSRATAAKYPAWASVAGPGFEPG